MDAIACLKGRRSIRKFQAKPVERALVAELIDCARWAPSWGNTKAVRYTAVDSAQALATVAHTLVEPENVSIVENAPLLLALSIVKGRAGYERDGRYSTNKGDGWQMFDTGVACQTLCLAAHALGLGTVILGSFDAVGMTQFVSLPEEELIVVLVACGYPAETPNAPRRKEVSEILRFR